MTASRCLTPMSRMPEAARSTSASSSARVNGTRSAVACTSIRRPRRSGRRSCPRRPPSPRGSRGRGAARRRRSPRRPRRRDRPAPGGRCDERPASARPRPGDGRRAGAAVGLEHVAVDPDGVLAQRVQVVDRAQRAAEEPLDLDGAALLLAGARLALRALARGGGSIPYSAVSQPRPLPASQRGTPPRRSPCRGRAWPRTR